MSTNPAETEAPHSGSLSVGAGESVRETFAIISAIVILLAYQGYTLSISGIASPWISKTFALDQSKLAQLFAWMSLSAFGSLALARWADRVGRRRIILLGLLLSPLLSLTSATA